MTFDKPSQDRIDRLPKWAQRYIGQLRDRVVTAERTIPWTKPGMEWFTLPFCDEVRLFTCSEAGTHLVVTVGKNDRIFVGRGLNCGVDL